ncbi:RICIN domain-containing protein [Streptomyces ossamyceticus]
MSNGVLVNPQSGKCLDATGGSSASGTRLQLYTCNGTAAQRWTTPAWPASRQVRAAAHLTLRRRQLNDRIVRLVDQRSG